ncbi:WecB/TagA/CpsF family glycosyltransferase [Pseudarthrobacter sp. PS3-L1]|uniref:WecB/TagA/CpsF family glycosyltransferase n=1 Tax=Pseudarthrobacter sp. PS3-L1 TaxID=3046207 RepID=UPI0024BB62F9|nr:WecB/TagA/CpsF family glycosyltransferase [Pseudarthrobacter sp. PS3-L1]MDJ0320996.1 WecB/TagA/CpsF family glycosyltransferase [Pseudarthrobacter sp. PS3-L1]
MTSVSLKPVRSAPAMAAAASPAPPAALSQSQRTVRLGGTAVDLLTFDEARDVIVGRSLSGGARPLAVASANLDHIKHFGHGSRWAGTAATTADLEWLTLLDGAPLVAKARQVTGEDWQRLAGSDLSPVLLEEAQRHGLSVGFLGGRPETQEIARTRLSQEYPGLEVAGFWAPERSELTDHAAATALAAEIATTGVDMLFVCLGKPRQELWIAEYGALSGAKVLLAFGAVVDFVAGTVRRAPEQVRDAGFEWAWRLALEPRRLASRYLVDGPPAYLQLGRQSGSPVGNRQWWDGAAESHQGRRVAGTAESTVNRPPMVRQAGFRPVTEDTDVAVLVVTYNSEETLPLLLDDLRREAGEQSIKVVVADNSPTPHTLAAAAREPLVHAFRTGGNLGYAAAINRAMERVGSAGAYLVLNPDLRVDPGAINALLVRMRAVNAGVVVPVLLDDDGSVYPSLRREPSLTSALGDALLGSRLPNRPEWLSEMDRDNESYRHAHSVEWATGAALLIRADTAAAVGAWDEQFFLYSEETDFFRRVRETGSSIWFEPHSIMRHSRGGSGSSPELDALMAANRVRYVRKHRTRTYAGVFHATVNLGLLLRAGIPGQQGILARVALPGRWDGLPSATVDQDVPAADMPIGSVIIPACNEAAVLGRTLAPLAPYAAAGRIEVIVACNGCTDGTEQVAASFLGVKVLQVDAASKVAAMNAANRTATLWPRVYLDADISMGPSTLRELLLRLHKDDTLAARPAYTNDTAGASWPVRAFYRARRRLPSMSGALWGAGTYAVTEAGHRRLGDFPSVTADDLYVDQAFAPEEKEVLTGIPVVVRVPRDVHGLMAVLRRSRRGNVEQGAVGGSGTGTQTVRELAASVRGPVSLADAVVYAGFSAAARVVVAAPKAAGGLSGGSAWERDNSSRI